MNSNGLAKGPDGALRCFWCDGADDYRAYHDLEWGFPVSDDQCLFEKVCLEGFQSGLSWLTILRKRDNFRAAFRDFDFNALAKRPPSVDKLLLDAGIVRHRAKIESTLNNALRAKELATEFGSLAEFFWRFEPAADTRPQKLTWDVLSKIVKTPESTALSKELKRRGWTFVGPTTMYALMQAVGLVNDHVDGCHVRKQASSARTKLRLSR